MEQKPKSEYRDELARKLKGARAIDKDLAEQYKEKVEVTGEYQNARTEKIENFKATKTEEQIKEEKIKTEEKIENLKSSILENKENGPKVFFEVLGNIEKKFLDKNEFGEDGAKAATEVKNMMNQMTNFLEKVKADYKKEKDYSGLTPQEFLDEYGIGNMNKYKSGTGMSAEAYSLEEIKKLNNKKEGKQSIHSFSLSALIDYDWKMEKRSFPGAKWKAEEKHLLTFTPKQEKFFNEQVTGVDMSEITVNPHPSLSYRESLTKIPGVSLFLGGEVITSRKDNKPIYTGFFKRYYGWRERRNSFHFKDEFIRAALEEVN